MSRPAPVDDVRQHIIDSLFSRKDPAGTPEETLISFVKVYEDEGGGGADAIKTRYLMLAVTKLGKVVIHKAKRNNNLSFSKGKTWQLEDMRVLEQISPVDFALTMTTRRYEWKTDKAKEMTHFLTSIVKVYKTYTKGETPELINFVYSAETRRPSASSSASAAIPIRQELAPPMPRQQRAGSSSSVHSESSYARSDVRGRPSIDAERPVMGRSPLGDSAMRAVPDVRGSSPMVNGGSGSGRGPPGRQPSAEVMDRTFSSHSVHSDGRAEASSSRRPSRPSSAQAVPRPGAVQLTDEPPTSPQRPLRRQAREARESTGDGDRNSGTRAQSNGLAPPVAPTIITTEASPNPNDGGSSTLVPPSANSNAKMRRRSSFHPPPLDTAFSREVLLTSRSGLLPGAGVIVDQQDNAEDAILQNVEELLEGFDWTAATSGDQKKKGADAIESRLLDELAALDNANIHAFLESDDRLAQVLGHIDEALAELEDIDLQITGYKMQLNAVSDDISYIESQNRGLQVQTSNQQALLNEIRQIIQIVEVPREDLAVLTQESPSTPRGVQNLEQAAASLYKALQAGMDQANAEVAATIARMKEYREQSAAFCKRICDYLDVSFKVQSDQTLAEGRKNPKRGQALLPHQSLGEALMQYEGLVLYVKEMDEEKYQKLCSLYFSTISQLHQNEIKDLLMGFMSTLTTSSNGEPNEAAFSTAAGPNASKTTALQKSKTIVGLRATDSPRNSGGPKGSDSSAGRVGEFYQKALTEVINQVLVEEDFISAFLHLTDTESTFADHMQLDSYFRRQAARHASRGMTPGMVQLVRSMMDLVFGFVDNELKNWVEAASERNPITIVSVIAVTERLAAEAEQESTSLFFSQLFDRQLARQRVALDMWIAQQVAVIDAAKNTIRRRRAVAFFIRHFPLFVERMEAQLADADSLPIRTKVNSIYERLVDASFNSLQQIAKLDRGDAQATEDKGQLNYHVIMIENTHQFVEDVSKVQAPTMSSSLERASKLYNENLSTYVRLMLRRSFGRLMDFFDGISGLLASGSTPANEVPLHTAFSRSALKKILKDNGAKDMRKAIEAMSRRVDKHFTDDDPSLLSDPKTQEMIQIVWRELTAQLKKETGRAQDIISQCYGESGLGLEYGVADVEAACKRLK